MPVISNQSIPQVASLDDKFAKSLGRYGSVVTNDTTPVTGSFSFIDVFADTVFSTLTIANQTGTSILIGRTIPAGKILYGDITAYTLASGWVIAYKSS